MIDNINWYPNFEGCQEFYDGLIVVIPTTSSSSSTNTGRDSEIWVLDRSDCTTYVINPVTEESARIIEE
jgi:hypothetical protein